MIFSKTFRFRDKPENKKAGSAYAFLMGGSKDRTSTIAKRSK